jgi:hypothetical protein
MYVLGIANIPIGLKTRKEAYLFAVLHGCALGPIQAYSRRSFFFGGLVFAVLQCLYRSRRSCSPASLSLS